jgi:hypothetical protein
LAFPKRSTLASFELTTDAPERVNDFETAFCLV